MDNHEILPMRSNDHFIRNHTGALGDVSVLRLFCCKDVVRLSSSLRSTDE